MKRRITAALLALVLIFTVLPGHANAAVYKEGDTIQKIGPSTPEPPEYTVGDDCQWYPLDADGDGSPDSTYLGDNYTCDNDLCVKTGRHSPVCKIKNNTIFYFYVGRKAGSGSGGQGGTQGPIYSDPTAPYPAGSASFTLRNVDASGNVLKDVEYYLVDGANHVKGHFWTNGNGEIFFGGLTLEEGTPDVQTWTLKQNPPLPEALADSYELIKDLWYVTVQRTGEDTFAVTGITFAGGTANLLDTATNTLTVENQLKKYNMLVTLKPVLVTEDGKKDVSRPSDLKVGVTIKKSDGEEITVTLPDGASPQAHLEGLMAGTYTVTNIECENAEIEGYALGEPYAVVALPKTSADAERPILEQNYIDLGSNYSAPDFWIYLPYTDTSDKTDIEISNTINIDIVDDAMNSVSGATVALMDGNAIIQEFNDETGYSLDLTSRATDKKQTYSLVQTVTPEGYHPAQERYTVEVSKKLDGTPRVVLKKDQSFLQDVVSFFSGDGVAIDPETGAQMATFTNARKTTQIQLACDVSVVFEAGTWRDAAFEEQCKTENTFTLTWTDASGETTVSMQVPHGETKAFEAEVPYGVEYKVEALTAAGTAFQGTQEIIGKVELADLEAPIHIDATGEYTIEAGVSQPLTMVKVDAEDTTKTLAGVTFTLTQDGMEGSVPYTTDNKGQILIQGNYTEPVSFALEETQAPEGYIKLRSPIQVDVVPSYVSKDSSDPYVLVQNFVPAVTHDAVEQQENGTYLIKNTLREVGQPVEGEHSNKLLISVVTESGSPVEGTQITMTCPDGSKKTYKNGDVIDLEELGMTGTYGLVQTKSVTGHAIAAETYAVTVSEKNGKLSVKAENTNQGLLDKIFNKMEIPYGPDGEWVLTFTNVRMTATLRLTCEVAVTFAGGSWHDMDFEKKYKEETEYQFLLSWDDGYAREQDEAMLVHGESEIFEMQVPYGVEYEIVCVNEKGYFDTTYRNAKTTVVDTTALKEGMQITATNTYIIEPDPDAEPIEMHLTKVDATTKKPLEGVEFELLDADDRKLSSYTTDADGKIDIVDVLKIGGSYSLKETKALSGYEKPSAGFGIDVDAKYKLFTASGKPVLKQSFEASISNKAVEAQEDGSYMVKNYKEGEAPKDNGGGKGSNPKTGDSFDIVLWSGILTLSAAGIALMAADLAKKKRRTRG